MRTIVKTVAIIAAGIVLSGVGINAYTANQNNQVDRLACTTVKSSDAVLHVEKDLLTTQHPEIFNKTHINIGDVLFHGETIERTHVIVPFSLTSRRRGQAEFQAIVRCSDLDQIEYVKL